MKPTDGGDRHAPDEEIHTEISTGDEYDGPGVTLAILTIERGERRLDYRIGYRNQSFAETHDLYHHEKLLHQGELKHMPDRPNGKFAGGTYHELLDASIKLEDDKIIEKKVWEREGTDDAEWAKGYLKSAVYPEEEIGEVWDVLKQKHDKE